MSLFGGCLCDKVGWSGGGVIWTLLSQTFQPRPMKLANLLRYQYLGVAWKWGGIGGVVYLRTILPETLVIDTHMAG